MIIQTQSCHIYSSNYMKKAQYQDKAPIVAMLTDAFHDNQSVNYVVKQDRKRMERIRALMDYSFEMCWNWGQVFISEDKAAAALLLEPHRKQTNLKAIWLDLQLALKAIGLGRVARVLAREARIEAHHPKEPFLYLWFIGVAAEAQGQGIGSQLLGEVIQKSETSGYPLYLETSTERNLPLYQRHGFETYAEQDYGFPLYLMRRLNG